MAYQILILICKNHLNPHAYVYSGAERITVGLSFHLNPNVVYESMEGTDKSSMSLHCRLAAILFYQCVITYTCS